jgi:hypothetical protein
LWEQPKLTTTTTCKQIAGDFEHHADAAAQFEAHHPI